MDHTTHRTVLLFTAFTGGSAKEKLVQAIKHVLPIPFSSRRLMQQENLKMENFTP
jgi:hypothetical protein